MCNNVKKEAVTPHTAWNIRHQLFSFVNNIFLTGLAGIRQSLSPTCCRRCSDLRQVGALWLMTPTKKTNPIGSLVADGSCRSVVWKIIPGFSRGDEEMWCFRLNAMKNWVQCLIFFFLADSICHLACCGEKMTLFFLPGDLISLYLSFWFSCQCPCVLFTCLKI